MTKTKEKTKKKKNKTKEKTKQKCSHDSHWEPTSPLPEAAGAKGLRAKRAGERTQRVWGVFFFFYFYFFYFYFFKWGVAGLDGGCLRRFFVLMVCLDGGCLLGFYDFLGFLWACWCFNPYFLHPFTTFNHFCDSKLGNKKFCDELRKSIPELRSFLAGNMSIILVTSF